MNKPVSPLWGPITIEEDVCFVWKLDHVWFWIKKRQDEWFVLLDRNQQKALDTTQIAKQHPLLVQAGETSSESDDSDDSNGSIPPDPQVLAQPTETPAVEGWSRFVTLQQDELSILPALPDRPLVVKPFMRVSLLPGRWAQFFVAVPVWISLVARKVKNETVFEEFPSQLLSNTWFGDPLGGELCYALHTPLLREEPAHTFPAHSIICPLIIKNASSETLQFQRLCIHVENLQIFLTEKGLVTNQINVVFRGEDSSSQIDVQKKPHKDALKPELVRDPREPMSKSVLRKTFDRFKEMTGF